MVNHGIIEVFSITWWLGILLCSFIIYLVIIYAKNKLEIQQKSLSIKIGFFLIFNACFIHIYQISIGEWNLQSSLPLNLCSISGILSGLALLFPGQRIFEFLLYWGIPGAFHSFMTPEMTLGNKGWYFYDYYLMHAGIFLSVIYMYHILKFRPRPNSWIWVFGWSQLLIVIVYVIDKMIGANYMYLVQKPVAHNPLIMGEWPWYILVFEFAGIIHVYVVYLIFKNQRSFKSSRNIFT